MHAYALISPPSALMQEFEYFNQSRRWATERNGLANSLASTQMGRQSNTGKTEGGTYLCFREGGGNQTGLKSALFAVWISRNGALDVEHESSTGGSSLKLLSDSEFANSWCGMQVGHLPGRHRTSTRAPKPYEGRPLTWKPAEQLGRVVGLTWSGVACWGDLQVS